MNNVGYGAPDIPAGWRTENSWHAGIRTDESPPICEKNRQNLVSPQFYSREATKM